MLNFLLQKILNVIKTDKRVNVKFVNQMNTTSKSAKLLLEECTKLSDLGEILMLL